MSEIDKIVELAGYKREAERGQSRIKYDLFCHPLWLPNNTWVWRFVPGVLLGFFGSLLLFSNRLRNGSGRRRASREDGLNDAQSSNSASSAAPVDVKLMLVVNGELKSMKPGKMGAQCGHAAAITMKKLVLKHRGLLSKWEQCGQKKICVKGLSRAHLESLSEQATRVGLLVSPVFDAGKTQVEQGSLTVVAIGPAEASELHPITDSFEALDEKVRDKLRALFDQGLVQEDELDDSILRRLSEIDPKEAVECLEQFSHCDLSRVRNKSAYIVGVMRRVRAPEHQANFQPNQNRNTTLHDSIKLKLNTLYNDGVCKPTDIDDKCLDKMAQLPIPCAIEALTQLANRDLSDIRSISRFLMSIINRVEQQYNSDDRRTTQTQPQIPIAGLGLIAPTPVDYTAALQPAVLPGIYPGLIPQFVNGKRNYAVEQLKMGVRVDEFHALSPHAPNIHPAIALKLQELWDSGVKLVAIIDDRVWGTLASMRAPEALICIEEMANQLNRIKNPNAYFMSMVRQYESHGLNTGRDKADGRFGNNGGRGAFQNSNRGGGGGNEACEEMSTLHQDVRQKIEEIVQAQNLYLRTADFDRGICYALAKLDSAVAVNLLSEFAEQPLENVNNMPAFIMSFIRRRQH